MLNACKALRLLNLRGISTRIILDTKTLAPEWPEEPLDLPVDHCGGFYPAILGNRLNPKYTTIRKLGWGQHSSVWLAQREPYIKTANHPADICDDTVIPRRGTEQYVAVKILTAHATEVQRQLSDELGLLRLTRDSAKQANSSGSAHIVELLDSFEISSSHGQHLCLVHEPMGRFPKLDGGLPLPVVKAVTKQLLEALDFLHCECRVVHTDIKPDNILVELGNFGAAMAVLEGESQPAFDVNATSSEPRFHPIPSRPIHTFTPEELLDLTQSSKLNIKLTDFGTAVTVDGVHPEIIQPHALRAPEVILGSPWGTSADVWNLGCLVFELLTGRWLFVPRGGPTWTPEAYHLAHMPAMARETFDPAYFGTAKNFGQYFYDDGELRTNVGGVQGLENALANYGVIDDNEMSMCTSFLYSMLRLRPSDRGSAAALVQHEWLKV